MLRFKFASYFLSIWTGTIYQQNTKFVIIPELDESRLQLFEAQETHAPSHSLTQQVYMFSMSIVHNYIISFMVYPTNSSKHIVHNFYTNFAMLSIKMGGICNRFNLYCKQPHSQKIALANIEAHNHWLHCVMLIAHSCCIFGCDVQQSHTFVWLNASTKSVTRIPSDVMRSSQFDTDSVAIAIRYV